MERRTFLKMIVAASLAPTIPVPVAANPFIPINAWVSDTVKVDVAQMKAKNYTYALMYGGGPLILSKLKRM